MARPGAQAVRDFIKRINSEYGITVVLTTHMIFEAEELCERVAIMDQGRIVESGTPEDIFQNAREARTRAFLDQVEA